MNLKVVCLMLFLLTFAGKELTGFGLNVWYQINKAEITRRYCVNKSRPQLRCNGKCEVSRRLRKMVYEEYQHDLKGNKPVKVYRSTEICSSAEPIFELATFNNGSTEHVYRDNSLIINTFHSRIFHPPTI